jgi:thioredoxin-like negative regulator of GroEL
MKTRRLLAVPVVFLVAAAVPLRLRADAPAPTPRAAPDRRIADARALVRGGKAADARKILAGVVEADPKNRDARKALLEAAALMKDWEECNAQTAALEPFADGEEVYMFYAAVALRETGSIASARALVTRARRFLVPSPFVDWYTKEILGN